MRNRLFFSCFLLAFWGTLPFLTQAQTVDPKALGGTIRCVSVADSLYSITVDVQSPAACPFNSFSITWDALNRSQHETVTKPGSVMHTYRLTDFLKNCNGNGDSGERLIKVETDCKSKPTDKNGDNKSFSIYFVLKPTAGITVPDVCAGTTAVRFGNSSCPTTSDVTYLWTFADGTTSTAANPSKSFPTATVGSSTTVTLATTNGCGTNTTTVNVPVRGTPTASYTTTGYTLASPGDTVVCLSNGGTLTLDGTVSIDETRYQWTISPNTYRFVQNTGSGSGIVKIQFLQAGDYMVTLTASNDCGQSRPITCKHTVVDVPTLTLTRQPDTCEPIKYKLPPPTNPNATYTLNGQPIVPGQEIDAPLSAVPYYVVGILNGKCGANTVRDTFYVRAPAAVQITTPYRQTAVCAGVAQFSLPVSGAGGSWEGSGKGFVKQVGPAFFFDPTTAGAYSLTYVQGTGVCRQTDAITITVEGGGTATAQNLSVCGSQPWVKLTGSPAGGVWQCPAFPTAVRNDTLFLAGTTGTSIGVRYQLSIGTAGCALAANATVSVDRPKAVFAVTGTCSGSAVTVQNTSTGAGTYQWTLNGTVISTAQTPALTLPPGQSVLVLTVGTGTCTDTTSRSIRLIAAPMPISFTPSQTSACAPVVINFAVSGTASPDVQYTWSYGNGQTSSVFQPVGQTYRNQTRQAVLFPVSVTARNVCGVQTFTGSVTARPLPKAEIGVDSTLFRCAPARVKFSNRSTGQSQPSTWNWADGSALQPSTADTLSHLFSAFDSTRSYRVTLLVSGECGRDTDRVTIRIGPKLVKSLFTIGNPAPCPGEPVTFTDATTPRPDRVIWRFGDGSGSTEFMPRHPFASPNTTYTISLTAITDCGSDSTRKTIRTVSAPTGSFSVVAPLTCAGQPVRFVNQSNPANRFRWDFGDGSPLDSVNISPEHSYSKGGKYAVKLTVFGASAACKLEIIKTIEVLDAIRSEFSTVGADELCAPGVVSLASSTTGANQWYWTLSDGQTATGRAVSLSAAVGVYDVSLVTAYNGVCRDSVSRRGVVRVVLCEVFAPGAFTPDGHNPVWTLFGEGIRQISQLRIRGRWGEVVYEGNEFAANNPRQGWDGTFNNKPMPPGEYTYEAELLLKDNRRQRAVGTLTLGALTARSNPIGQTPLPPPVLCQPGTTFVPGYFIRVVFQPLSEKPGYSVIPPSAKMVVP